MIKKGGAGPRTGIICISRFWWAQVMLLAQLWVEAYVSNSVPVLLRSCFAERSCVSVGDMASELCFVISSACVTELLWKHRAGLSPVLSQEVQRRGV